MTREMDGMAPSENTAGKQAWTGTAKAGVERIPLDCAENGGHILRQSCGE